MLSPLSTESLRCFQAAAQLLNFRTAARAVALSPSAFGQRIRQLEDAVGVPLFHRTTRSVVLTAAGLALAPQAEAALRAVEDCRRAAQGGLGELPLELVLGTRHELGMSWVLPQVGALERAVRGLTLHLYFGSGADLALRVRAREIDCAITSSRLLDPGLEELRLHEERYAFVGAPVLLRARGLERARDAGRHVLLDVSAELPLFRYFRDAAGPVDSLDFARVLRYGTIAAIREAVLRGQGVAVLPRYYVAPDLARRRLRVIFPKVEPRSDWFRLVFRAGDPRRSQLEALAAALRARPLR